MRTWMLATAGGLALLAGLAQPSAARITRLDLSPAAPAFDGRVFPGTGKFERLHGKAYGEVDPKAPGNVIIQDLALAPRNAHGMVEYVTDIDIVRPADPAHSNHILLFNVINRGNKGALTLFNADVKGGLADINNARDAGDGWLQAQGYTLVWFGWQADVLPGNNRMGFKAPVAHNPDGSPIIGTVRSELVVQAPTKTSVIGGGWFTETGHDSYPTANTDNAAKFADGFVPTLTVRVRENAPRVAIPNTAWSFSDCTKPAEKTICLPDGFLPGHLYELTYRAKDPTVLGLGFAAARDLGAFLKGRDKDDSGTANPVVHGKGVQTLITGSSQSGRFIRTLIHLGFNRAEAGGKAFDGAMPHIGGGLISLNIRFAQPGRAWGSAVDHLYPAYDFPFTYARQTDPLTGRTQGVLDRCTADHTCPRIVHAATALEIWDGRQGLGFTDPLGTKDLADPPNVRSYIMASTQHGPANLPLPTKAPFGVCMQQGNPTPHVWTMRALLSDFTQWLKDDRTPPPSNVPRIADGTLVAADQVHFPAVPANSYGGVERPAMRYLGNHNPLHVYDRGPGYHPADSSGIETIIPPREHPASYGVLVPQVDADGNDLAGVRPVNVQVPIGTYTGWNLFRDDLFQNEACELTGSFVPFAATKAERLQSGDPRLSLEERYPSKAAYVQAVRQAADRLIAARLLLPEDGARLTAEAEATGIRTSP